jgi:hypothetical protein
MSSTKRPSTTIRPQTVISNDRKLAPATTGTAMPRVKPSAPAPNTPAQNGKKQS